MAGFRPCCWVICLCHGLVSMSPATAAAISHLRSDLEAGQQQVLVRSELTRQSVMERNRQPNFGDDETGSTDGDGGTLDDPLKDDVDGTGDDVNADVDGEDNEAAPDLDPFDSDAEAKGDGVDSSDWLPHAKSVPRAKSVTFASNNTNGTNASNASIEGTDGADAAGEGSDAPEPTTTTATTTTTTVPAFTTTTTPVNSGGAVSSTIITTSQTTTPEPTTTTPAIAITKDSKITTHVDDAAHHESSDVYSSKITNSSNITSTEDKGTEIDPIYRPIGH